MRVKAGVNAGSGRYGQCVGWADKRRIGCMPHGRVEAGLKEKVRLGARDWGSMSG